MGHDKLSKADINKIDAIISKYEEKRTQHLAELFRSGIVDALQAPGLSPHVHSIKSRLKETDHLRDKLERKVRACKSTATTFEYTPENFLEKINDIVGVRVLHLHTTQVSDINRELIGIFKESKYELMEEPFARTWDDESVEFFTGQGIKCEKSASLYTSVHYVIGSNSETPLTAEIQVRTLSEEVWGEVNHAINYPLEVDSLACREQLRVLARATSTATRLVDSIFASYEDHKLRRAP